MTPGSRKDLRATRRWWNVVTSSKRENPPTNFNGQTCSGYAVRMSLSYAHLLIAESLDFVPKPEQVIAFLQRLAEIGSAPLDATFKVGKPSDKPRVGMNPRTGQKISIPRRASLSAESVLDVLRDISGLNDCDVIFAGKGPVSLQPFGLYVVVDSKESECKEPFYYEVACHLRSEPVTTSVPDFGRPCQAEMRPGVFQLPNSDSTATVPNAGNVRFWIEFRFGKWPYPRLAEGSSYCTLIFWQVQWNASKQNSRKVACGDSYPVRRVDSKSKISRNPCRIC